MRRTRGARIAAYITLWLVSATAALAVIPLVRSTVMAASLALRVSHWALGFVEKSTIIAAFLGWALFTMLAEPHYQKGVDKLDLGRRFLKVTCWQAGLAVGLVVLQIVTQRLAGG